VADGIRERDGLAAAGRFSLLRRVAVAADEPAQAGRVYGDRTLRAALARLRPMGSASLGRCFASAVITWAGHRHPALANRRQPAVPALMPSSPAQRCSSPRKHGR
jgi:hypothetical protein